jgi:hypothetical protein
MLSTIDPSSLNTGICNNCGLGNHPQYTCFYYASANQFDLFDLTYPAGQSTNLLRKEYAHMLSIFNLAVTGGNRLISVKLIVNKQLEERYAAKKES